jgi:hypothetical protein
LLAGRYIHLVDMRNGLRRRIGRRIGLLRHLRPV